MDSINLTEATHTVESRTMKKPDMSGINQDVIKAMAAKISARIDELILQEAFGGVFSSSSRWGKSSYPVGTSTHYSHYRVRGIS